MIEALFSFSGETNKMCDEWQNIQFECEGEQNHISNSFICSFLDAQASRAPTHVCL